jgi:hypothetical protein
MTMMMMNKTMTTTMMTMMMCVFARSRVVISVLSSLWHIRHATPPHRTISDGEFPSAK